MAKWSRNFASLQSAQRVAKNFNAKIVGKKRTRLKDGRKGWKVTFSTVKKKKRRR